MVHEWENLRLFKDKFELQRIHALSRFRPGPHVGRFCFKKDIFFLRFGPPSTRSQGKRSPFFFFLNLSKVKIFENAGHSFTCGRTITELFEYEDVIHHILSVSITHDL